MIHLPTVEYSQTAIRCLVIYIDN